MTTELILYDEMWRAIAAAHGVDEVKDIRDKALAIEIYSRQARNVENEKRAIEIRIRAERRCGKLLARREKAKGGRPPKNPSLNESGFDEPKTLNELGISESQSARWQKLAAVPGDEFEATFVKPEKPSTGGIIAAHQPPPPPPPPKKNVVDDDAVWLWGTLLDFERNGLLERDPNELCAGMLPHMKETVRELAPRVAEWLTEISI